MYIWQLKRLIKDLPDEMPVIAQDGDQVDIPFLISPGAIALVDRKRSRNTDVRLRINQLDVRNRDTVVQTTPTLIIAFDSE